MWAEMEKSFPQKKIIFHVGEVGSKYWRDENIRIQSRFRYQDCTIKVTCIELQNVCITQVKYAKLKKKTEIKFIFN